MIIIIHSFNHLQLFYEHVLNFISFSYLFTTYHQIFIFEIVDPYELCFYLTLKYSLRSIAHPI